MLGYFILKEEAEKLGLVNNSEIKDKLQQTYFVVTDRDVRERTKRNISTAKLDNISNYLNKNYFDGMVEVVADLAK